MVNFEPRKSSRVSIGKKEVHLRLPITIHPRTMDEHIQWAKDWLEKVFQKKPDLLLRFKHRDYQDGDWLIVGEKSYLLTIRKSDKKSNSAKLEDGTIFLNMSQLDPPSIVQQNIKTLLSRIIGRDFLPEISKKVHELNALHFNKSVKNVKLRYTHSRWGSCSTKGNINLSTRLLFAPEKVIDYVIIHELAHLIEANHSPSFWNLVQNAMPSYREQENWLKKFGHQCDF